MLRTVESAAPMAVRESKKHLAMLGVANTPANVLAGSKVTRAISPASAQGLLRVKLCTRTLKSKLPDWIM